MNTPLPRDLLVKAALEHVGELMWLLPVMKCPCVPGRPCRFCLGLEKLKNWLMHSSERPLDRG